jgi:predicted lipoprotein with Yx(FWY)xxD motif
MRKLLVSSFVMAGIGLAAVGCGSQSAPSHGSTNMGASTAASAPPPPPQAAAPSVSLRSSNLGTILADSQGKTLYLFEADKKDASSCYGACASTWPPATTGSSRPVGGPGVDAAKLATIMRSDGKLQLAYNGHPLYYYVKDTKLGDTTGEDIKAFGADWYIVSPLGEKIGE